MACCCHLGKIRNRAYEFHEMIIFANRHLTLFAFFYGLQ